MLKKGADAVSVEMGHRCQYCDELKRWEIIEHFNDPERLFAYPLPCECDGVKEAERKKREADEKEMQAAADAWQRRVYAIAGLDGRLLDCTFDSFKRRKDWTGAYECVIKARKYWNAVYSDQCGTKPWLVLYGQYGTGKTHLAAAVIREAISAGWNARFHSWTDYLTRLQHSWDRDTATEKTSDIVNELKEGRIIALDDIDKRESRGWAQGELYAALNYRYNACLPTVLTFNCAPGDPELEKYANRATVDRVIESAFYMVNFDGPSYRSGIKW